jgi:asparagine synthase (glutamine-hydrolysing)
VTLRFPGIKAADETEWQEKVVRHLGVKEWERIEITGDLDFLGPVAIDLLRRHGLLWPTNIHTLVPAARAAAGGTVMTGFEGDGLLGNWRWWGLGDVVAGRSSRRARDLARFAYANAPRALRRARMKRGDLMESPWLTREAEREFALLWMQGEADEPGRWGSRIRWWSRRRYLAIAVQSVAIVGADHDAAFGHPLLDPTFLSALALTNSVSGLGSRTHAMHALFGDLLPKEVIERPTKALFTDAFWGEATREFTLGWNGEGIDPAIVDAEGLKTTWRQEPPETRTAPLLHWIWLTASGEGVQQPLDHG